MWVGGIHFYTRSMYVVVVVVEGVLPAFLVWEPPVGGASTHSSPIPDEIVRFTYY